MYLKGFVMAQDLSKGKEVWKIRVKDEFSDFDGNKLIVSSISEGTKLEKGMDVIFRLKIIQGKITANEVSDLKGQVIKKRRSVMKKLEKTLFQIVAIAVLALVLGIMGTEAKKWYQLQESKTEFYSEIDNFLEKEEEKATWNIYSSIESVLPEKEKGRFEEKMENERKNQIPVDSDYWQIQAFLLNILQDSLEKTDPFYYAQDENKIELIARITAHFSRIKNLTLDIIKDENDLQEIKERFEKYKKVISKTLEKLNQN